MTAWRANLGAFSLFALILTVVMLVWARVSLVTFALFFSSGMPSLSGFLGRVASVEHLDFVLTYFAVGAVFAVISIENFHTQCTCFDKLRLSFYVILAIKYAVLILGYIVRFKYHDMPVTVARKFGGYLRHDWLHILESYVLLATQR